MEPATSGPGLSLDEKLREMQQRLAKVKKERQIAELQELICEEERLLQASRQRLNARSSEISPISPAQEQAPSLVNLTPTSVNNTLSAIPTAKPITNTSSTSNNHFESTTESVDEMIALESACRSLPSQRAQPSQQVPTANGSLKFEPPSTTVLRENSLVPSSSSVNSTPARPQPDSNPQPGLNRRNPQIESPWWDPPASPGLGCDAPRNIYYGRNWRECEDFVIDLEVHFSKNRHYYADPGERRKVKLGIQSLAPELRNKWAQWARSISQVRWNIFCRFVAYQANPNSTTKEAIERFTTSKQFTHQSVLDHYFWMLQWEPKLPATWTRHVYLEALWMSTHPLVRNRANRPAKDFVDWHEYANYLWNVEKSIPARVSQIRSPRPGQMEPNDRSQDSNPINKNQPFTTEAEKSSSDDDEEEDSEEDNDEQDDSDDNTQREKTSQAEIPLAARTSVPTPPANSSRPPTPVPKEPKFQIYQGATWAECRNFLSALEHHFDTSWNYFKYDSRKLDAGLRHIKPELKDKWNNYRERLSLQATWADFRNFAAQVAGIRTNAEKAIQAYKTARQPPSQTVSDFALWLQQWMPYFNPRGHNRLRHIYDRMLPSIRSQSPKTWEDFTDLNLFVEYLQDVEDSMPEREEELAVGAKFGHGPPKKRPRRSK
ncbi:hypothetical protein N7462_009045 [Penicillium macrosclerotiorum]|uniref:uncharacterized protein n=1 Tax=Penicillium macrosclerotiorum TaxID=303699 RepID=UPI00254930FA|nr:uncharacterized protein N7462_009045 [Penicillium macrosclerotiorum]KAJ5676148.1 hypothetical protein N7462_009045 [Penicillium macrosclerotiorum]